MQQRTAPRQKARSRRRRRKKCAHFKESVAAPFQSRQTVIPKLARLNRVPIMPKLSNKTIDKSISEKAMRHSRRAQPKISSEENLTRLFSRLVLGLTLCLSLELHNQLTSSLAEASTLADFDGATFYKAPVGSRVRIACNASHWHDDSISLVLWFKGGVHAQHASNAQPIYTIDARQIPLSSGQARHIVADSLRGRARFVLPALKDNKTTDVSHHGPHSESAVPYLDLAPLDADDQGEYRCRVDYRSRPRENFLIILFVLVPPSSLEIMDTNGRSLEQIYGPLNEGAQLTLLCLSKGGRPAPAILWRRNGRVIDDSYLTLNDFLTLKLAANGNGTSGNGTKMGAAVAGEIRDSNLSDGESPASPSPVKLTEWPEFNYFLRSTGTPNSGSGMDATRRQPEVVSADRPAGRAHPRGDQERLLIDWHADRAMTTGANVLHLAELTRAQLTQSGGGDGRETSMGHTNTTKAGTLTRVAGAGLAQLECHASNMHYDLHSLIKIFAPPSLLQSVGGDAQTQPAPSPHPPPSNPSDPVPPMSKAWRNKTSSPSRAELDTAAFAQAVERAVLANLRNSPSSSSSSHDNELPPLPARQQDDAEAAQDLAAASAARFVPEIGELSATAAAASISPGRSATAAAAGPTTTTATSSEKLNWQQLIYQQLVRPHQLAIAAQQQQQAANSAPELAAERKNGTAAGQQPMALERSKLIALEANLRPLDVKITSPARPLTAGQVHEFTCQSSGSRPPARLSWLKNGRPAGLATESGDGQPRPSSNTLLQLATPTISQSRLALKIERHDHGARLSCRAENANFRPDESTTTQTTGDLQANSNQSTPPMADNWQLEDAITLNVHYSPQARLELGNKMLSERIRENQDIYFVCQVDAQPPVTEITWLHNDRPINETVAVGGKQVANAMTMRSDKSAPIQVQQKQQQQQRRQRRPTSSTSNLILSNNSLVLQRVQLEQAGEYACLASNSEGVGLSNRLELRVSHAPVCVSLSSGAHDGHDDDDNGQLELHLGTFRVPPAANQPLKLTCQMLVPPAEDLRQVDEQLELSWYLGAGEQRRLVARQTRSDLKLIEVETMSLAELLSLETTRENGMSHHPDENDNYDDQQHHYHATKQPPNTLDHQRHRRRRKPQVVVGQLSLDPAILWDDRASHHEELAAGQQAVYCLARNSMGEQKRSCVYAIERSGGSQRQNSIGLEGRGDVGGENSLEGQDNTTTTAGAGFACLPVNVTTSSVWIVCNSGSAARDMVNGPQPTPPALEISQVEENNDQLRASVGKFRFNVLVYSSSGGRLPSSYMAMTNNHEQEHLDSNREQQPLQLLEANLSSHALTEPLFAVVNLRAATNYLLDISDSTVATADAPHRGHSLVRLRTAASASEQSAETGDANGQSSKLAIEASRGRANTDLTGNGPSVPRPSIRQVTEPHPSDLVAAALISTRSTLPRDNQHHLQTVSGASNQRQQVAASSPTILLWHKLTFAVNRMFSSAAGQGGDSAARGVAGSRRMSATKASQQAAPGQVAPIRWINLESADGILALGVCVAVLLLTLIGLIALHRTWFLAGGGGDGDDTSQARTNQDQDQNKRRASGHGGDNDHDDDEKKSELLLTNAHCASGENNNGLQSPPSSAGPSFASGREAHRKASLVTSGEHTNFNTQFNQRYSTLQFQQRTTHDGTPPVSVAKPSINFLRTSSIASNAGSLRRQAVALQSAYGNYGPSDPRLAPRASSVTRSRSSQGFQAAACDGGGDEQLGEPLLMLDPSSGGPRLMQPSGNFMANDSAGKQRTQLNNSNDNHDCEQLQSGKCLISDANLVFAACGGGGGGDCVGQRSGETGEANASCARADASPLCNCHELALINANCLEPSQLIGRAGVHFSAASPSVDSTNTTSCSLLGAGDGSGHELTSAYQTRDNRDDDLNWQLGQQAHFVELLPRCAQTGPTTMMALEHEQQQQQQQQLMIVAGANKSRQHHVLFNQSLNSCSSPGGCSPAGFFGSPQLSLGTNETTTTLSNPPDANFVLLTEATTLADHQYAYSPHDTIGRLTGPASMKLGSGASTSNYSSDGSSSAVGAGSGVALISTSHARQQQQRQQRQAQPAKPRLTSILKQQQQQQHCKHIDASNNGDNNSHQQRASTNQPSTEARNPEIVCQCSNNED